MRLRPAQQLAPGPLLLQQAYAIGISRTHWRIFAPALLISVLISDSILVAVGAGAAQGASLTLGLALLAMFALATVTGLLKRKSASASETPAP